MPTLRTLGYLTWLVMLAMSILFYKQRAFFMDGGFQLFNLINEEAIQIYHYRFVTALPQIIPFLFLKMGAPLWLLALSFSVSYILFYLLVYHLLVRHLKQEKLGWALIFLFTLISLDTFYHIQSEFYLGLSLLLLAFGVVLKQPDLKGRWQFWALVPLLVTVGFSHKLAVVFFLFGWLFFGWRDKALRHGRYVGFLVLMLAVAAVKSIWFTNWYEAAKQVDFQNNLALYFPHLENLPSNKIFFERCLHNYYMLPLLLAVVSGYYLMKKQWFRLALVWSFLPGYLLLYNISDPAAQFRFYSEVTYLPLTLFVSIPFLFDVVPALEKTAFRKWLPALFAAIIVLRLATICWNSRTFDRLYAWIDHKLEQSEQLGTNRLLLKSENAPQDTVLMEWGVPFTAMLLSASQNPSAAKTLLILPDFERYKEALPEDGWFLSPFKEIEVEKLNERYFDLGRGRYVEVRE